MCCPAVVPEWLFVLCQAAIVSPPISEGTEQAAASSLVHSWEKIVQLYSTSAAAKGSGRRDLN